jgi:hypothetical protein
LLESFDLIARKLLLLANGVTNPDGWLKWKARELSESVDGKTLAEWFHDHPQATASEGTDSFMAGGIPGTSRSTLLRGNGGAYLTDASGYPTPPVNLTPGVMGDTPPPVTGDTTPLSTVTPEPSVNRQGNQQTARYAELVAVIAHKRSREGWVDDQEKVENATTRGLRQGQDCVALKACLARHPMSDLAELADLYLDHAIPGTKKYRPRWE